MNSVPAETYLDHAASSPLRAVAREALLEALDLVGNPSALHRSGQRTRRVLEDARESLAESVGAHPTEVVLTSGGSEADSIALLGSLAARPERTASIVGALEHPAVLGMAERGARLIPAGTDGTLDVDAAAALLDEHVAVCSVMAVNNETGIVQPVDEIRRLAQERGIWMHSDQVQALGHVPVDFGEQGLDLASLSAHKIGGPVGVGALLVRRGSRPTSIGLGGAQEGGIRSGTAMVALAAGFAAAAREAVADLGAERLRLGDLQERVVGLATALGGDVTTVGATHAPHIINVVFPGLRASDLLFLLDRQGVRASVGSACRAGVHQPSEVLLAMGRGEEAARSVVRFSLGHSSTGTDVDRLGQVLPDAVATAREAYARH